MDCVLGVSSMKELELFELFDVEGGTVWGVVNGVFTTISGVAGVVCGAALLVAPEPTGLSKVAAVSAIIVGVATAIGGIATVANNI